MIKLGKKIVAGVVGLGVTLLASPLFAAHFTCATEDVNCLVEAIAAANDTAQEDVIDLEAGRYTFATAGDSSGFSALPEIRTKVTIRGEGAATTILQRAESASDFRFLKVAAAGTLTLERLTLRGGKVEVFPSPDDSDVGQGGALVNAGVLYLANIVIAENRALLAGGGILNRNKLTMENVTILNNQATNSSGGVGGGIDNYGQMSLRNCTIRGNYAHHADGGGITNRSEMELINCTVTGNSASGEGGGGISTFSVARLINCTISYNHVAVEGGGAGGGILSSMGSVLELQNTILADNTGGAYGPNCYGGELSSLGNNFFGDLSNCSVVLKEGDLTGDSGLGEVIPSKSPGKGHIPLLPESPAIDAGNNDACPPKDQLGTVRPVDGDGDGAAVCDIGAVEYELCALNLTISYTDRRLILEVELATTEPLIWNLWILFDNKVQRILKRHLPVIPPYKYVNFSLPWPYPRGTVGVLSTLHSSSLGIRASDFQLVDTGTMTIFGGRSARTIDSVRLMRLVNDEIARQVTEQFSQ